MANLNFDATNINPNVAFDPLPPGWYACTIVSAEITVSEKAGEMLKLQHEIDGDRHPEFAGRRVFNNLCINHPNQQPREIAQRTLSAIAHAVGHLQLSDTDELLGKALEVKVKSVPAKDGYDAKNEVSGYKAIEGAGITPTAKPAAAPATAPATTAAKPSWRK